jgi:hypothetical protein
MHGHFWAEGGDIAPNFLASVTFFLVERSMMHLPHLFTGSVVWAQSLPPLVPEPMLDPKIVCLTPSDTAWMTFLAFVVLGGLALGLLVGQGGSWALGWFAARVEHWRQASKERA